MRFLLLSTCSLSVFLVLGVAQKSNVSGTCVPPGLPLTSQKPDFATCLIKINNFTLSQRADSGCFLGSNATVLTYAGCNAICGSDYSPWDWKDTVDRLALLVLPAIVLIAHLAFPPLGFWNYLVVTFHAVGNPIGSFRSILTRLERHRRLKRAAAGLFAGDDLGMKATAVVFSTYEELSWQDLSAYFATILTGKTLDPDERAALMRASHRLSSTRLASTTSAAVAIAALIATLTSSILQTINKIDEVNTRVYNETTGTIAVVCILFMSIPQVWFSARLGTFTTDSGATHILERMNDRLKEVIKAKGLTHTLFPPLKLETCPLQAPERRPRLILWLFSRLPSTISRFFDGFFSHCPLEATPIIYGANDSEMVHSKVDYLSYISLNSAWRPCRHLAPDEHGRSHTELTLISLLGVVLGACLPAAFLSLTNHLDQRSLAVGCRALSWITILGIWLCSFGLDPLFRFFVCRFSSHRSPVYKVRFLWKVTVVKDAIVFVMVLTIIFLVEVGRYNSCWCRASFSHPSSVTLFPYTAKQWSDAQVFWISLPGAGLVVNIALILWVELKFREWRRWVPLFRLEGGSPLCKTAKEMQDELDELKILERKDHEHEQGLKDQIVVTESTLYGHNESGNGSGYMSIDAIGLQEYGEISNGREERPMRYY